MALDHLVNNPDLLISLATQLKQERFEKERLAEQNALANATIQAQAPKVQYFNQVLQSESTYLTTHIAKELGMSAKELNKRLKLNKVQYLQDGVWVLYAKYQDKEFTKTRTYTYYDTEGNQQTSMRTVWTEKGRQFIHGLIKGGASKEAAS